MCGYAKKHQLFTFYFYHSCTSVNSPSFLLAQLKFQWLVCRMLQITKHQGICRLQTCKKCMTSFQRLSVVEFFKNNIRKVLHCVFALFDNMSSVGYWCIKQR